MNGAVLVDRHRQLALGAGKRQPLPAPLPVVDKRPAVDLPQHFAECFLVQRLAGLDRRPGRPVAGGEKLHRSGAIAAHARQQPEQIVATDTELRGQTLAYPAFGQQPFEKRQAARRRKRRFL
jgi:hypothetical protein